MRLSSSQRREREGPRIGIGSNGRKMGKEVIDADVVATCVGKNMTEGNANAALEDNGTIT